MRMSVEQWRDVAYEATMDFIGSELAFTPNELEAKLSDNSWGAFPRINPHHLTTARLKLVAEGRLESDRSGTRGGGFVSTFTRSAPSKEAKRRAGRKRLLQARYLSWTKVTSDWNPAPVPAALERVVHGSLIDASPHGYRLASPAGGEIQKLFGARIPGGSMDNAAHYSSLKADGTPGATTTVLIEAKNLRQWIYPRTQELFQLLDKAVSLQVLHPDLRFAPVLVCRKLNAITAAMAKQTGFHIIETKTQYIRPVVTINDEALRLFNEVNDELGYNLTAHEGSVAPMTRQFTTTLPQRIDDVAQRWSLFASHPEVPDTVAELRDDEISSTARFEALARLASCVVDVTGEDTLWANADRY